MKYVATQLANTSVAILMALSWCLVSFSQETSLPLISLEKLVARVSQDDHRIAHSMDFKLNKKFVGTCQENTGNTSELLCVNVLGATLERNRLKLHLNFRYKTNENRWSAGYRANLPTRDILLLCKSREEIATRLGESSFTFPSGATDVTADKNAVINQHVERWDKFTVEEDGEVRCVHLSATFETIPALEKERLLSISVEVSRLKEEREKRNDKVSE